MSKAGRMLPVSFINIIFYRLAAYLESEPERKKAALEAQKQKLEALERQLERSGAGANESEPSAIGKKRRLDDTEFLEESQNLVDNVKSAVVQGERICFD